MFLSRDSINSTQHMADLSKNPWSACLTPPSLTLTELPFNFLSPVKSFLRIPLA